MSRNGHAQHLTCPFCPFGSRDSGTFERHVHRAHDDQERMSKNTTQPRTLQQPHQHAPNLSDSELAQLLAFEEAGLPAELALPDHPAGPAYQDVRRRERAPQNSSKITSSHATDNKSWVQCVCGERVDVLELDAHSDMHAQENISIDEPEMHVKSFDLSTMPPTAKQPLADTSNLFSTDIPKPLRNYDQIHTSRTPPSAEKRRGPSLRDIFLGSPVSPKRKFAYSAVSMKNGKTKRLGVS